MDDVSQGNLLDRQSGEPMIVSARGLQFLLGMIGILLPIIALAYGLGVSGVRESISAFYYVRIHGVFVGMLCMAGAGLLCYKGYEKIDFALSRLAGLCAIVVGLFPTQRNPIDDAVHVDALVPISLDASNIVHGVAAGLLFILLTIIVGFLFPRSRPLQEPHATKQLAEALTTSLEQTTNDPEKRTKNVVFRLCAVLMLAAVVVAELNGLLRWNLSHLTFWMETVALLSFGISWFTKSGQGRSRRFPHSPLPWGVLISIALMYAGCVGIWCLRPGNAAPRLDAPQRSGAVKGNRSEGGRVLTP